MNLFKDLPEGYQPIFVYYSGHGIEQYFTAPSIDEAREFIIQEKGITQHGSAFPTSLLIKATFSYFLRYGIPVICLPETNLLINKEIEQ